MPMPRLTGPASAPACLRLRQLVRSRMIWRSTLRAGGSGSRPDARCSVTGKLDRRQRSVSLGADFELLMRVGAIADDMLLPPIEHQLDRCIGLAGEVRRDYAFIAGAKFGSETAAHI